MTNIVQYCPVLFIIILFRLLQWRQKRSAYDWIQFFWPPKAKIKYTIYCDTIDFRPITAFILFQIFFCVLCCKKSTCASLFFKVRENKVSLYFRVLASELRYGHLFCSLLCFCSKWLQTSVETCSSFLLKMAHEQRRRQLMTWIQMKYISMFENELIMEWWLPRVVKMSN